MICYFTHISNKKLGIRKKPLRGICLLYHLCLNLKKYHILETNLFLRLITSIFFKIKVIIQTPSEVFIITSIDSRRNYRH